MGDVDRIMNNSRSSPITPLVVILLLFGVDANVHGKSQMSSTRAMIASLKTACDVFEVDTGQYPTESQGLKALVSDPGVTNWQGPYLYHGERPLDVWGNQFRYRLDKGEPVIDSPGPDKVFGTDDDNGKNLVGSINPRQPGCAEHDQGRSVWRNCPFALRTLTRLYRSLVF